MKANEFLRDNGLTKCSRIVDDLTEQEVDSDFVKDLKRLVESHELVESFGGLESSKLTVNYPNFLNDEDVKTTNHRLSKAILDVESCQ